MAASLCTHEAKHPRHTEADPSPAGNTVEITVP
jgi:hypothetical protein